MKRSLSLAAVMTFAISPLSFAQGLTSFDIGNTITKIRSARINNTDHIVGTNYDGAILLIDMEGNIKWKNELSGFMNHDIWAADIDNNGNSEIYAANADGNVYAISSDGDLLWSFKPSDAPMNTVTTIRDKSETYVVAGGYDLNYYYLSADGEKLKTVSSKTYSKESPWGSNTPPKNQHTANFIRPLPQADGTDHVLVHGIVHSMAASGSFYEFEPMADSPYKKTGGSGKVIGDIRVHPGTGNKIIAGNSSMIFEARISLYDLKAGTHKYLDIQKLSNMDNFGYRVVQTEKVDNGYFTLFGSRIILSPDDLNANNVEVLVSKYSYNDIWKIPGQNKILMASAQSGGSAVHIIDLDNNEWKQQYKKLVPPGNIQNILATTTEARNQIEDFEAPPWEKSPRPVNLITDPPWNMKSAEKKVYQALKDKYDSPVFLNNTWKVNAEDWDRSSIPNSYRTRRDGRMTYNLSQQEVLDGYLPLFDNHPGLSFWGGHGNDPYLYSYETLTKIIDGGNQRGKQTVLTYPELESHTNDFAWVLENHFYPLAKYAQGKNVKIFVRSKHTFWQAIAHLPMWRRLMSGEFADVFVPAMEETTDKSMDLSVPARVGTWMSGATNNWGVRVARDSTSFDRTRQFSHQMLPNGYLREMIYTTSLGATYINNFGIDQAYFSILWELLAKGVIYVPERNELLNISPVHIGLLEPDEEYLHEGNNVKWTSFFNQTYEDNNPMVFGRLNGTWPGAPVTEWDYSRFASGVKDRRLNFLPSNKNGLVVMTPVQDSVEALKNPARGKYAEKLNPIYQNHVKEFITDGRNYYSKDGKTTFRADEHYREVEVAIQSARQYLPIAVSGDVAWVTAQSAEKHIRLTLIESGFINPKNSTAYVEFNGITPVSISDLLTGEEFSASDGKVEIPVKAGGFRFFDIELKEALAPVDSSNPTPTPTPLPTELPTIPPTAEPTAISTPTPTAEPTPAITPTPTTAPSIAPEPSIIPTATPIPPIGPNGEITIQTESFNKTGKDGSPVNGDVHSGFNADKGFTSSNTKGDWAEYDLSIISSDEYWIEISVASESDQLAIELSLDDEVLVTADLLTTGGWGEYWLQTITDEVFIEKGNYTLKLKSTGQSDWQWNADYIRFTSTSLATTPLPTATPTPTPKPTGTTSVPSPTALPTVTPTTPGTATPTITPTITATPTNTPSPAATATPTPAVTATTPTALPEVTATPTSEPVVTIAPTASHTATPASTATPTFAPTFLPTNTPTPSSAPTSAPLPTPDENPIPGTPEPTRDSIPLSGDKSASGGGALGIYEIYGLLSLLFLYRRRYKR